MPKDLVVVLDIPVVIPMKKVKDKICTLGLNWYCNAHRFDKDKVKKQVRIEVEKYLRSTGQIDIRFDKPVKVNFQYFKKTAIRTDTSNFFAVGAKFVYDALVELEVLPDDSSEFIVFEQQQQTVKDKDHPRMMFYFEEVES